MSVKNAQNPTLYDVAGTLANDTAPKIMIEALSMVNGFFDDITMIEANNGTTNDATIRSGLPKGTWRKFYQGVQPEKSAKISVSDKSAQLTSYSSLDKGLHDRQGANAGIWRKNEDAAFLEGLSQSMLMALFYGDISVDTSQFNGLASRYSTRDPLVPISRNVLNGGGTGDDNTSIWVIQWSPQTTAMFYPKGTQAGLQVQDKGQQTVKADDGGFYEAYQTYFEWNAGLSVLDWRSTVRIANIDVSLLKADISTGADLPDLLDDAIGLLPTVAGVRTIIYMTQKAYTTFKKQVEFKSKYQIKREDFYGNGRKVPTYDGYAIRIVEQLLDTEEAVTAV